MPSSLQQSVMLEKLKEKKKMDFVTVVMAAPLEDLKDLARDILSWRKSVLLRDNTKLLAEHCVF